jgi:hypothetical protein
MITSVNSRSTVAPWSISASASAALPAISV